MRNYRSVRVNCDQSEVHKMWKILASFVLIGAVAGRVNRAFDEDRLRETIAEQCRKYGADDHIEEVTQGVLTFADCLSGVVDKAEAKRIANLRGPEASVEYVKFVKQSCKNQNEIIQCFNNVYEAIKPCTDPKEKGAVEASKRSTAELADLFCKDESKKFTEFIYDGALTCMENQLHPIIMCMNKIVTLQNYKTLTTEVACAKVNEVTTCIVDTLTQCPQPTTASFVSDVFKTIMSSSACVKHDQEDDDKAKDVDVNTI